MHRNIVITGATRGLGLALFNHFVEAGHAVRGCGRSVSASEGIAVVDVADAAAVWRWAEELRADGFIPDLLINNAGMMNHPAPLWEIDAEEFASLLMTNVAGVMHTVRAFLPKMLTRGSGIVVNLSSGWGRSVDAGVAPYCASKWAVEGLTLALAEDLPAGFAAVPLNPGVINTDMLRSCWPGAAAAYPAPEQWARIAAPFLLGLTAADNGKRLTVPGVAT